MKIRSAALALPFALFALSYAVFRGHAGETPPFRPMVVDLHVDVPYQVHFKNRDPALREGDATQKTLISGGYGGIVLPIYMHPTTKDGPRLEDASAILSSIESIVAKAGLFTPVNAAHAEPGKISVFLSIEGAGAFAKDISAIDSFIDRGVRLIGPVHSKDNDLGSSATGKNGSIGLTDLGKAFCRRVYEHGAVIDISHLSDKGVADLVPIAEEYGAPIVATHSNARAIADHPRNLTDDQLRQIGKSGGVAGLNFHSPYVSAKEDPTIDDIVAHALHMIKIAGIDAVAIGSDYDGGIKPVAGLEDASSLPRLALKLRQKGLSDEQILKIFSLNALRVLAYRRPGTGIPGALGTAEKTPSN